MEGFSIDNNNSFKEMNSGLFMEYVLYNIYRGLPSNQELSSYTPQEKSDCPFHGFKVVAGSMVEIGGNRCALKEPGNLCQKDIMGNLSSWVGCSLNTKITKSIIEINSEKIKVFSKEFFPPEAESWKGISLGVWMEYITNLPIKK